jgi:hypothetical protein
MTDPMTVAVPRDLIVQAVRALYRQGDDWTRRQLEDLLGERDVSMEACREVTMTARIALLPRSKYRVVAEVDGWGVYARDDNGAFA